MDADVVGCNVDSTNGVVFVVDTSNPATGRANNLDITQVSEECLFSLPHYIPVFSLLVYIPLSISL